MQNICDTGGGFQEYILQKYKGYLDGIDQKLFRNPLNLIQCEFIKITKLPRRRF